MSNQKPDREALALIKTVMVLITPKNLRPIPKVAFHYTNENGALGILEERKMRATHIGYLNDKAEFFHAIHLVIDIIKKTAKKRLKRNQFVVVDLVFERLRKLLLPDVYVASFSENKDQLSQWRAYSKYGGFSIGFDLALLSKQVRQYGVSALKCIYDRSTQEKRLKDVVVSFYQIVERVSEIGAVDKKNAEAMAAGFTKVIASIAPSFKHPSFSEESEIRFIYSFLGSSEIKEKGFYPKSGIFVPFVKFPIDGNSLVKEIVVGPSNSSDLSRRSLELFKKENGYAFGIEISSIPYRPNQ